MADLVSEIISPEVPKQLDAVSAQLDHMTEQVSELALAGKNIQFEFKGANNFAVADEVIRRATASAQQFTEAQNRLSAMTLDAAKALQAEARANLDNAKAATEAARQATEAAKQREIETRYTAALTREKERLEKQLAAESRAAARLGNDYELLKQAYKDAADKAKNLGVTLGTNSAAFRAASADAMRMHEILLRVETAVGQAQRNVGNYASAMMSVSQILREAPAFANSLQTGLMAVSNNIPILMDEFRRLRTEVGSTGQALKILGGSIFGFTNLFILGFTALQFYIQYLQKAKKETNEYTDAIKKYDVEAKRSATEEIARSQVLLALAKDETVSREVRERAVKQLQKLYPDYLGNLSEEAILTGHVTKEVTALNEALFNKALMEAANKKIGENATKYIELTDKLEAARAEQNKYADDLYKFNKQVENYNKNGGLQPIGLTGATARQGLKNATEDVLSLGAQIASTRREGERFAQQAKDYAKAAGFMAVDDPDKGKKDRRDREFKGAQDLADAEYELKKKIVEQDKETQQKIYENTEKGLQDRINAYTKYQADMLTLAQMEKEKQIAIENAYISEHERLAKGKEGQAQQNEYNLIAAANVRKKIAIAEFENVKKGIVESSEKDALGIIRTSNEQWLKDQAAAFNKLKLAETELYNKEKDELADALEKKLITRKAYDKDIEELQAKQRISTLQAEINEDEELLKNDLLLSDQRLKILEDLQKKKEELGNAKNKGTQAANPNSGSFRITDPLAGSLLPSDAFKGDLKKREDYLNEFYSRSTQLAQEATAAIIAAQNQQYDNQIKHLDIEKTSIQDNAQLKEMAINAGAGNAIEKENEIAKLRAQTQLQEEQIEQKKRQVSQERARFEKAAAIANIIESTAVAIAGALKYGPGAPAIIALIAAAGAVQLASVAAAPIPAYKDGTDGHGGGLFIAGDGGEPEFIKAPNKAGYWSSSKSALYNEASGTTVTPLSKIMGMDVTRMGTFNSPDSTAALHSLGNKITNKLDESIEATIFAAKINRVQQQDLSRVGFELRKQRNLQ